MKTFDYTIKDALGIHARPAGLLVKEVGKYQSKIWLLLCVPVHFQVLNNNVIHVQISTGTLFPLSC